MLFDLSCLQLSHMRLELHGVDDQSDRNAYIAMMSHFKRRIGAIQKKRLTASSPSSLSSSSSHGINQSLRSRQMLQVDKQRSLIQKLKYAHRQMAQSESIGLETIDELESQNHQTRRIYQTTTEINSDLNHSRTMLNKISQWWRV